MPELTDRDFVHWWLDHCQDRRDLDAVNAIRQHRLGLDYDPYDWGILDRADIECFERLKLAKNLGEFGGTLTRVLAVIMRLDALGVQDDAGVARCRRALNQAGIPVATSVLREAVSLRAVSEMRARVGNKRRSEARNSAPGPDQGADLR
jgi:hypothetical protein